jgi:hypothetical protein
MHSAASQQLSAWYGLALLVSVTNCQSAKVRSPPLAKRTETTAGCTLSHPTHARPAALPEVVPAAPSPRAEWLPGYWKWQGNTWVWQRGGWIENPKALKLKESFVRYDADGSVLYCERSWLGADGREAPAPPIVVPAATPLTASLPEGSTIP